jgi:hypothetical protein
LFLKKNIYIDAISINFNKSLKVMKIYSSK